MEKKNIVKQLQYVGLIFSRLGIMIQSQILSILIMLKLHLNFNKIPKLNLILKNLCWLDS